MLPSPSRLLVSLTLVQQDKSNPRPTTARFLFPRTKKAIKARFPQLRDYNTLAKSWHRAPHGSFILCAIFFGHSAVSSSSQSMSLALRLIDETIQPITAVAPALLAGHAQHIELADEIAEDDCAVAGHGAMIA